MKAIHDAGSHRSVQPFAHEIRYCFSDSDIPLLSICLNLKYDIIIEGECCSHVTMMLLPKYDVNI